MTKQVFQQTCQHISTVSTSSKIWAACFNLLRHALQAFCANCGAIFKRLHWSNRGRKTIVWRCSTRLANKEACAARTIREEELQEGFLMAVREIIKNSSEYTRILNVNLELAIQQANLESVENLDARMAELQHSQSII